MPERCSSSFILKFYHGEIDHRLYNGKMIIWAKKDTINSQNVQLSFDPPEEDELEDWLLLTTRERHYKDISKELEKQAIVYQKENDFRSARVCKDLAKELRSQVLKNVLVN